MQNEFCPSRKKGLSTPFAPRPVHFVSACTGRARTERDAGPRTRTRKLRWGRGRVVGRDPVARALSVRLLLPFTRVRYIIYSGHRRSARSVRRRRSARSVHGIRPGFTFAPVRRLPGDAVGFSLRSSSSREFFRSITCPTTVHTRVLTKQLVFSVLFVSPPPESDSKREHRTEHRLVSRKRPDFPIPPRDELMATSTTTWFFP